MYLGIVCELSITLAAKFCYEVTVIKLIACHLKLRPIFSPERLNEGYVDFCFTDVEMGQVEFAGFKELQLQLI
ncbi:hypothetical protein DICVIV_10604 [Dictyocaulus viviparus]|uniref:Uncharacterized protein n=1 Tax=Dictyocaulus viviparus TaxID=29172 RepID=A0A0D8XFK7_DICVI|nr:hypothetical protein DICVIV_10604 [Dictyocaulus viviparus]